MNKKTVSAIAFLFVLIFSTLTATLHFGTVQASTNFSGIINSDTTWTKANSPYNLKGPVAVNSGVTLTVEAGVTANLNGYYIQVNGTLVARSSSTDKINLNDGSIVFTAVSNSWNEQTGSGSIIENAVLSNISISIINVSPKINNNSFSEIDIIGGSPVISYNTVTGGIHVSSGSPSISYNDITNTSPSSLDVNGGSPSISHNTINNRLFVRSGSPVISNNKIADGIHADSRYGQIIINDNEITVRNPFIAIYVQGIHAEISNNTISSNGNAGINIFGSLSSASISDNIISDCSSGIGVNAGGTTTIVRNLIFNNEVGISFEGNVTVRDNTITGNSVGIQCNPSQSSTITNNNIQDNSQYNFRSESANDVIATNNWWGITDSSVISQTIYDNKFDFNLGTVNFAPFLTASNPEAPPIPSFNQTSTPNPSPTNSPTSTSSLETTTPTATVAPSQSPSQSSSPSQNPTESPTSPQTGLNGIEIAILAVLIVIAALLAGILAVLLKKKR